MLRKSFSDHLIEAGCDEAGRGCMAGPVTAAAVILPRSYTHPLLRDSKQLNEKQRAELKVEIEAKALADAKEVFATGAGPGAAPPVRAAVWAGASPAAGPL